MSGLADAIIALVDAKIDQAFARIDEGGDGYRHSTPDEDRAVREAEAELRTALTLLAPNDSKENG